jgi:Domain of unknown function (DUF397)
LERKEGMATETDLSRAAWQTSSYSGNGGNCVEVARNLPAVVAVRDSKNPDAGTLVFSLAEWNVFLGGIRQSQFS